MGQKKRLSVPLSYDLYEKIEKDAEKLGVSPATFASVIIGNHYKTLDVSIKTASDILSNMLGGLIKKAGLDESVIAESLNETKDNLDRHITEHNDDEKE